MKVVLWIDGKTEVMVTDSKCCPLSTLCEDGRVRCELIAAALGEGICPCNDTFPDNCPLENGPVLIRKVK